MALEPSHIPAVTYSDLQYISYIVPNVDVSDGRVDVARRGPGDEVSHGGNHGALDVLLDLTGANL